MLTINCPRFCGSHKKRLAHSIVQIVILGKWGQRKIARDLAVDKTGTLVYNQPNRCEPEHPYFTAKNKEDTHV